MFLSKHCKFLYYSIKINKEHGFDVVFYFVIKIEIGICFSLFSLNSFMATGLLFISRSTRHIIDGMCMYRWVLEKCPQRHRCQRSR